MPPRASFVEVQGPHAAGARNFRDPREVDNVFYPEYLPVLHLTGSMMGAHMRVILRFLVASALAMASFAQGPWVKKDWKQWSKDDCKKILEDSPWAQRWTQSEAKVANFATRTRG